MANEDDGLVGLLPDDTVSVPVRGAVFTLGVVPGEVWASVNTRLAVASQDARRRAIAAIAAEGGRPDEVLNTEAVAEKKIMPWTAAMERAHKDPVFVKALFESQLEAVVYSVRGHDKFVDMRSKPIPCVRVGDSVDAYTRSIYRANPAIVAALYPHVRRLNDLEDAGKKASPL